MRRIFNPRAVYTLLAGCLMLGIVALATPAAQAAEISQGYYLYYQRITSIHANCIGKNHYIQSDGYITLDPYRVYKTVEKSSETYGNITYTYYWQDGFSSAWKEEWCRNNDYVYEFFGKHKVQRIETVATICFGAGCQYGGTTYTPWQSKDWD